jgi:hypothetical protein
MIVLKVRRLVCAEPGCGRRTFAEQVQGLTVRYGRSTPLLLNALQHMRRRLMAAKAYRLLRAVLMTATGEDPILQRNPCRICGAGDEHAQERPVLTVGQVFELADRVGRRPVGNVRGLKKGQGYRLRFQRHGEMRTFPEVFATRGEAERAHWVLVDKGQADCTHDRRFRAFVLLTTFASLRWGEIMSTSTSRDKTTRVMTTCPVCWCRSADQHLMAR